MSSMMAQQAAGAASGPTHSAPLGYEQHRPYVPAPQGTAVVRSQASPAAVRHPFYHQGEPDALNPKP